MKKWIGIAVSVIAVGLIQAADITSEIKKLGVDPNISYSGTRHMETKEGQMDMFVRHAPQKMRMEMTMQGQTMAVITREDLGVNYTLMPQMNMYREVKTSEVTAGPENMSFSDMSKVGRETINGYDCTKYRAKFTDAKGGKAGGYYWVSDDGIMMKIDMIYKSRGQKGERMVFTLRDVEIGEQDPKWFELPGNYKKFGFNLGMAQNSGSQSLPNQDNNEPNLGDAVGDAAKDESERAIIGETRNKVRKAFGKLFKKK